MEKNPIPSINNIFLGFIPDCTEILLKTANDENKYLIQDEIIILKKSWIASVHYDYYTIFNQVISKISHFFL